MDFVKWSMPLASDQHPLSLNAGPEVRDGIISLDQAREA